MALACRHLDVALPLPGGVAASFGAACSARKVARDVSLERRKAVRIRSGQVAACIVLLQVREDRLELPAVALHSC